MLLSLATLATAWSGYQAALWSGEQSQRSSQASALRVRSGAETVRGGQLQLGDLMLVNGWFNATETGNRKLASDYDHILSTVCFAAVLFLAAVSLRLEWMRPRIAVLVLGLTVFLGALVFVLTLPTAT